MLSFGWVYPAFGQAPAERFGHLTGTFQLDGAWYRSDSLINAQQPPEQLGLNTWLGLQYTYQKFTAAVRYEAFLPPLVGIDPSYRGQGVPYRNLGYHTARFDATVGTFYEQFGSGLALRAWWEPLLGYDNALDGVRIQAEPFRGVYLKGVAGRQRRFFDFRGLVRGGDLEIDLPTLLDSAWRSGLQLRVGGSFVSRYQPDEDPVYILPTNTAVAAGRLMLAYRSFRLDAEYAYKSNDPSATNNLIYRPGQAAVVTASFAYGRWGASVGIKRLDNMDFRSDRFESGQNQQINFLPPFAKQHTYRLPSLYVYATQPNGETGIQADLTYAFSDSSSLKGLTLTANFTQINALDTVRLPGERNFGYTSDFLSVGQRVYYRDFNLELAKKWSKKIKSSLTYYHIDYDKDQILGLSGFGVVRMNAVVLETGFRLKPRHTLRVEAQWMGTEQDFGSWAMLLAEYTFAPHWFVALSDEYNYGNRTPELRVHYYAGTIGWTGKGLRFTLGYGRQRAGILCVGGICRVIPATNGLNASIQATF